MKKVEGDLSTTPLNLPRNGMIMGSDKSIETSLKAAVNLYSAVSRNDRASFVPRDRLQLK